jgi:heat shock protein HtpX
MAAAYGLYSHIQSNKRRSIALLLGLFFLVYVMVFAGALAGEALYYNASLEWLIRAAWRDLIHALPWATGGTILWVLIAYRYHQSLIDSVTGAREVTRKEEPRLYNLLENLCISRGIPMPKLKVIDEAALNAFASGLNQKQYSITVTTGLLERLDDAEVEAVLGHELTHIRNGDVRMLVIALVIAGVIGFFAELIFRMLLEGGLRWRPSRSSSSSDSGKGGGFIAIAIAMFTGTDNIFSAPEYAFGADGKSWLHLGAHVFIGTTFGSLVPWVFGCGVLAITRKLAGSDRRILRSAS